VARFLIDAQLPPALARTLTALGHQAEHVEDVGLRHAKDPLIWDYAVKHQAAILTKDEDFVDRFRRRAGVPVIIWLRIGNASNRRLLVWFLPALPAVLRRLESGDRLIEVR
jgi:predicted nuclease of predicted toxin-antitoxin system